MTVRSLNFVDTKEADFETIGEDLCAIHMQWHLEPESRRRFSGTLRRREYGGVIFTDVQAAAMNGYRQTSDINGDTDDYYVLSLYRSGRQYFEHSKHDTVLGANDILFWHGLRPAQVKQPGSMQALSTFFPRPMVERYIGNPDDLCGRKVGSDNGTSILLASHLSALHDTIDAVAEEDQAAVFRATLDMVGACFRPKELVQAGTSYQQALWRRIEAYIHEHCMSPGFGPAAVAAEFGFSVRNLHFMFNSAGTTFTQYVRNIRLSQASFALLSPTFASENITKIAAQLGFCDAAHFSKCFKSQYGCSPSDYRRMHS